MEQQTVTLTPFDNTLVGKYRANTHVLVKLDASEESFAVNLPDSTSVKNVVFDFIRTDQNWANNAVINPFAGQKIKNGDSLTVRVDDSWEVRKENDGVNWWIG